MRKKYLRKMTRICELQDICRTRIEGHVKQLNAAQPLWGESYVDFQNYRITLNREIIKRLENYYQTLKTKI